MKPVRDVLVGMGEIVATKDSSVILTALGLGSCIGIFAYESRSLVACCAHVVLPRTTGVYEAQYPAKSMDTAFDNILQSMDAMTNGSRFISWALLGGAQLFTGLAQVSIMDIGARNIASAKEQMAQRNINPVFTDFGGNKGRTAKLYVHDGILCMRRLGQPEQKLADMRRNRALTDVNNA